MNFVCSYHPFFFRSSGCRVGHLSGVKIRGAGRGAKHKPYDDDGKFKDSKELSIV